MKKEKEYADTISLILVGDQYVGKTSLLKRFTDNTFNENILGTVGIEYFKKVHAFDGKNYLIKVWDTCGQERFRSLTINYYRNADGIILVFDLNEPESFDNLKGWIQSINNNIKAAIPKVVIGNKSDLPRRVPDSVVKSFVKENPVTFYESSAKLGQNINRPFEQVIKEVLNVKRERDLSLSKETNAFQKRRDCNC